MRSALLALVLGCLLFCPVIGAAETMDKIVAMVNSEIILYSELKDQIKILSKATPELSGMDQAKTAEVEREVLQRMIREKLVQQEAVRLKIKITDRDVDEAIESVKTENKFSDAQIEQMYKADGQDRKQFREAIRKEVERGRVLDRVLKSKTVITQEQIDAQMKGKETPATAVKSGSNPRLALIFIPAEAGDMGAAERKIQELQKQIKGGESFGKLAKEHSKGPAAEEGGDIGVVDPEELAPDIRSAVKSLGKNEVSGPVKSSEGYYLVKVIGLEKGQKPAVQNVDREKVRRQLYQQELNRKLEEWVRDLESRAFIKVQL